MLPTDHLTESEKHALQDLRRALESRVGERLERLVLFGSKARGDYDADSDLDVAVVIRGLDRDEKREIFDLVIEIELRHDTPISSWVLSSERLDSLRGRERRIAQDIDREGIPI